MTVTKQFLARAEALGKALGASGLSPGTPAGISWRFTHAPGELFLVSGKGYQFHVRRIRWEGEGFAYKDGISVDLYDPWSTEMLLNFIGIKR